MLQNIWPTPYKIKKGNIVSFLVQLIIFLVIVAVLNFVASLLQGIAVIGIVFSLVRWLLSIYSLVGIVLCVLCFLGVCKAKKK